MKSDKAVSNYDEQIEEQTKFVSDQIHEVIGTIGPRESGYESEHKAQDYVADLMEDTADKVEKEPMSMHPHAFMGWVPIDGSLMTIASLILILLLFNVFTGTAWKWIMLVCTVISVVCIVGEFLLYKEMLDPLFPKKDSYNVVCTRKAAGETKRRIVFSGHIDSAYEWHYTYLGGGHLLTFVIAYSIISLVANLVMDILVLCGVSAAPLIIIMKILALASLPAFITVLFFLKWNLCVPGANDNLTGVFASMAVMRFLDKNDIRFENTEVISMSTSGEEAGLRGAKAFAKAHAKEYEESGVETICICTDTLRDFDDMGIYNKDMSGTVKLDAETADLVRRASQEVGLDLPYANVFFGSSDAAALAQGGMKACCLAAMDPTPARYYHTRLDTPDNLDPKTISAGIKTLIETAFLFDAGELHAK